MSAGYDPFKWADNYESKEDFLEEFENDSQNNKNQQSGGLAKESD